MLLKKFKSMRPKKIDLTYFHLSIPAFISAVAYIIMCVIILLPVNIPEYDDDGQNIDPIAPQYNFGYRILLLLILLIPFGLSIYSVNCMMTGGCVVWSYIQSILIVLWVLLFIVMIFLSNNSNKMYFIGNS